MVHRVRQFLKGLRSYVSECDMALVYRYLNQREREVFLNLPRHEIRHAVGTASTIEGYEGIEDKDLLIKAALLHDIGKVKGKAGIIRKSIMVIFDKILPKISRKLSGSFSMFNLYYNHPEIGANLLRNLGTEEKVILLVRYHHCLENVDIKGIEVLKRADSLN